MVSKNFSGSTAYTSEFVSLLPLPLYYHNALTLPPPALYPDQNPLADIPIFLPLPNSVFEMPTYFPRFPDYDLSEHMIFAA